MCELTVFIDENGEKRVIGEHIVKAVKKGEQVVLMDAAGVVTKTGCSVIHSVDTMMQEMVLKKG